MLVMAGSQESWSCQAASMAGHAWQPATLVMPGDV